jgi:VanZ family protein
MNPPRQPAYRRTARALTALYAGFIVWGSFYPFEFIRPNHALLARRLAHVASHHVTRGDLITNLLFYIPFGALCTLAIAGSRRSLRALIAVLIGSAVSFNVELLQLFTPHRVTSIFDWTLNTLGTVAGAAATVAYLSCGDRWRFESIWGIRPALIPMSLILLWLVTQLAPYAPIFTLAQLRASLSNLNEPWNLSLPTLSVQFTSWWIVGLAALNIWRREHAPWALLTVMLLTLVGRLLIIDQRENPAEILVCGAVLAGLSCTSNSHALRYAVGSMSCVAALLLSGLWPFEPAPSAGEFHWIPFSGNLLLTRDYQPLLDKVFLYAALIWVLTLSFGRLQVAFPAAFVLTTAIELAQIWLPDRRAEITDPLLVVMLAGAFVIARRFQGHAFGVEGARRASEAPWRTNN